jgi:hypothetical protein
MSISIEEFYQYNQIDESFDAVSYLSRYPYVSQFYQPHCRDNNISEKHRLYYHYMMYGEKDVPFMKETENSQKINEVHTKQEKKYIYLKPINGIANRIFNISSFVDFAKKFTFEKIYICWSESQGFSYDKFEDLFSVESVDKSIIEFISKDEYIDACKNYFILNEVISQNQYTLEYQYLKPQYDITKYITDNTFCYSWFAAIHYLFPSIINPSYEFIRLLKPNKSIQSILSTVSFPSDIVGVHIRRGDAISTTLQEYHRSTDASFINKINNSKSQNFFLATDCEITQKKIINSCPNKNILTYSKQFDSSNLTSEGFKPSQKSSVVEMYLLAKTKEIIGTRFSTFGLLSSMIQQIPFTEITADQTYHMCNIDLPPISLVIGVKNRFDPLKLCLHSWINQTAIQDIVIVDWDSQDLDKTYLQNLDDRIRIVQFKDEPQYHIAKVINECIKNAKYEHIIKCDVDYIANPYYQLEQWLDLNWEKEFMTGSWTQKTLDNDMGFMQYLNGLMICKKKHIEGVGMYDERYTEYGLEDSDLYDRLTEKLKLIRKIIPNSRNFVPIYHNPHMDYKRTENYSNKDPLQSIKMNRAKQ